MGWLWLFVGFALGAFVFKRIAKADQRRFSFEAKQIDRHRLEAESRYLDGLRRELALRLLDDDPQALLDAHAIVSEFKQAMRQADSGRRAAERKVLSLRYPNFIDFDLLGLRHFVPAGRADYDHDEIARRYVEIGKFLVLLQLEEDSFLGPFDHEDDPKQLERIVLEHQDAKLIRAIDTAMGRFYAFRQDREAVSFEDRDYAVRRLPLGFSPEIKFGVTIKATEACGVYSYFVHDEGNVSYSYARSDPAFSNSAPMSLRSKARLSAA